MLVSQNKDLNIRYARLRFNKKALRPRQSSKKNYSKKYEVAKDLFGLKFLLRKTQPSAEEQLSLFTVGSAH